jgi:hypothetical protein
VCITYNMAVTIGSDMQRKVNVRSNCFGAICIVIAKDYRVSLALLLDMQQALPSHSNTVPYVCIPDRKI